MELRRVLGAVLGSLVAAASCRQIAGIDDRATGPHCGGTITAHACGACMDQECCSLAGACTGACRDALSCVASCADQPDVLQCRAACRAASPDGFDDTFAHAASCVATSCATPCAEDCGGFPWGDATCAACVSTKCCREAAACAANAMCAAYRLCHDGCAPGNPSCTLACLQSHDVPPEADALDACLASSCKTSCGDPRWSCAGTTPAGDAGAPNVTIALHVRDMLDGSAVPGLSVSACARDDLACAAPLDGPLTTHDDGSVTLSVAAGFEGYIDLSGADTIPALAFMDRPVLVDDPDMGLTTVAASRTDSLFGAVAALDPGRSIVLAVVRNCTGSGGAGVSLALSPPDGATLGYFTGDKFDHAATVTDSSGLAVFVGATPGTPLVVTPSVQVADATLATQTVQGRAGALSLVFFRP